MRRRAIGGILFAVLSLSTFNALAEPLGLVLSGGGARGAYQVGVWKALHEVGVASNVTAISGVSVGAINAALFAMVDDPDKIESFWLQKMDGILKLNLNKTLDIAEKTALMVLDSCEEARVSIDAAISEKAEFYGMAKDELPSVLIKSEKTRFWRDAALNFCLNAMRAVASDAVSMCVTTNSYEGFFLSEPLRRALDDALPLVSPPAAPTVYVTSLQKGLRRKSVCHLRTSDKSDCVRRICASAAMPFIFSTVQIDGGVAVDGGWESQGGDNLPISPIVANHPQIKTIYVVSLSVPSQKERRMRKENYPDKTIIEIAPSEELGNFFSGALNFDTTAAKKNIALGYDDAQRVLSTHEVY